MSEPTPPPTEWSKKTEFLLKPISDQAPCGGDGRSPKDFTRDPPDVNPARKLFTVDELEAVISSADEKGREPDWGKLKERSEEVLQYCSKHLRAAVVWTIASTMKQYWDGLARGITAIAGLVERYWPQFYPELDGDSATERANMLSELSLQAGGRIHLRNPFDLVSRVKRLPLLKAKTGATEPSPGCSRAGFYSYAEVQAVFHPSQSALNKDLPLPSQAELSDCWQAMSQADLDGIADTISTALEGLQRVQQQFKQAKGNKEVPDFSALSVALAEIQALVRTRGRFDQPGTSETSPAPQTTAGPPAVAESVTPFSWANRDEALRSLEQVRASLERAEPLSPAIPILALAIKLSRSNFLTVIAKLSPDTTNALKTVFIEQADSAPTVGSPPLGNPLPSGIERLLRQRETTLRLLEELSQFFQMSEPSSPLAYLIKRSIRAACLEYYTISQAVGKEAPNIDQILKGD